MDRRRIISIHGLYFKQGFTLTELMVVVAIMMILAGIALPLYIQWLQSTEYRTSARTILCTLRETRSMAITTNLEHRVEFDNANRRYRVMRGNRSSNSSDWNTVARDWNVLPPMVHIHANVEKIHLNPTGMANPGTIEIRDTAANKKYEIRVANTGRARIP
jgi:type II secretion system protein H